MAPKPSEYKVRLIDSHCHLTHGRLVQQVDEILQRAAAAGVEACIIAAGDLHEAAASVGLCQRYAGRADRPALFFTAGVHPHEAKSAPDDLEARLAEFRADVHFVAIGEIGLDYHYDFSPRDVQRAVFARQLATARTLDCKVVIHTREAFEDTMAVLRESGVPGQRVVFHSCTELRPAVETMLDFGASVGFSGIATFKKADDLRQAAALVPADRILIETDAPYLAPEPVRSMRNNEPANVAHVAACLAKVRNIDPEEFATQTADNARRFFRMG